MIRTTQTLIALSIAVALAPAWAQDAADNNNDADSAGTIEEVIVSARRREESLQEVPIAISVFSTEAIEFQDLRNLEDLSAGTVGMSYLGGATSGYQAAPTIRGLSSGFLQNRIQNVAVFLDGVYLQRQSMMNMGLMDMERVEVVKGPQNTMYGNSAFAGAINFVTQKPTPELDGYLGTVQGTDERADYTGAISGPIIDGVLLGRAAVAYSEFDGTRANHHPYADANPAGFNNRGNLGGWDDKVYNVGLTWTPSDAFALSGSYYGARLKRENQPHYVISGLREVAAVQTGRYDDMNFNPQSMLDPQTGAVYTGNTMWEGELPFSPGDGTCINGIPIAYPCPAEDMRSHDPVLDPRAFGFTANTDVYSLRLDWELSDSWDVGYIYGNVSHDAETAGPAERDVLTGATLLDVNPFAQPFPILNEVNTNISSARPITELDMSSHELRFNWDNGGNVAATLGLYASKTEDSQHDMTIFAPVCGDRDVNGNGTADDERANCEVSYRDGVDNTPLNDVVFNPFFLFAREYWHGNQGNLTDFEDEMRAAFATVEWAFNDQWRARLEGRYTREDRSIHRRTDGFALPAGEEGCVFSPLLPFPLCFQSSIRQEHDQEDFSHFTYRATLEFNPADDSLLYGTIAKGVKSGGFNNAFAESQLTYEPEENILYEIGSKNVLADGRLVLNASIYYIDWSDMQGSEPPVNDGGNILNGSAVIGNIGDVKSRGVEVEANWLFADNWSLEAGVALNKAEFKNGTEYDAAQRYYYYQCDLPVVVNGQYCGNTDVDGNSVPRNPERQAILALNFNTTFSNGWNFRARLDANYQSKQYITPLNVAYIPGRTLANANLVLASPRSWEFNLWAKNLADEDYVGGVILIAEQNKLMVSQGPGFSMGLGIRYRFGR